ncbi:Uncharacterised protein [Candidatus Burarchaeum australiense]|nr:Uncharacterised protein [Candidatus Burarchaeum australiense]
MGPNAYKRTPYGVSSLPRRKHYFSEFEPFEDFLEEGRLPFNLSKNPFVQLRGLYDTHWDAAINKEDDVSSVEGLLMETGETAKDAINASPLRSALERLIPHGIGAAIAAATMGIVTAATAKITMYLAQNKFLAAFSEKYFPNNEITNFSLGLMMLSAVFATAVLAIPAMIFIVRSAALVTDAIRGSMNAAFNPVYKTARKLAAVLKDDPSQYDSIFGKDLPEKERARNLDHLLLY